MSIFFRAIGSNNVFYFYEDKDVLGRIKTISYNLGSDGSIQGQWEKIGTLAQLMGAIKSVEKGNTEIITESEFKKLTNENKFSALAFRK